MKTWIPLAMGALCAAQAIGCAAHGAAHDTPVMPPTGLIVTMYKAPLTTDFDRTDVSDKKQGTATTYYLNIPYWIPLDVALGNATIEKAAKNGKITDVAYADYEILSVMGIFAKFSVTAYGD